jgi:hypothetical protein
MDDRGQAGGPKAAGDPLGTTTNVLGMGGLGANRGDADVVPKAFDEVGLMAAEPVKGGLEGGRSG